MTFEVQPVRYLGQDVERCAPEDADAWGLYRRLPPDEYGHELAVWIADYHTEAGARLAQRVLNVVACVRAFFLGVREFRQDLTTNPGEDLIECYDRGRELAHRLTLRVFDGA